MQAPELTLAAAIRDADLDKAEPRHKAIRNLAPALLTELDKPGPRWRAAAEHQDGEQVIAKLRGALGQTDDVTLRCMAAIGLGMIGEASVVERVGPWVELSEDTEEASFQRECAVIALSFIGVAAGQADDGAPVRADVKRRLVEALRSDRPDVRFQAALAVAEVGDDDGEATLREALQREEHPEVRDSMVDALSRFESPSDETCAALLEIALSPDEGPTSTGFAAAMILAGAGRPEAGPRLLDALRVRHQRDQALEALAVLGEKAPDNARAAVTAVAHGWLTPGPTRARAAYALARLHGALTEDNPGLSLLRKLAWHPRAAVREAVADAHKNLARLG